MYQNQEHADKNKQQTLELLKDTITTLSSKAQRADLSYARCLRDIEIKGTFTGDDLFKLAEFMKKAEELI